MRGSQLSKTNSSSISKTNRRTILKGTAASVVALPVVGLASTTEDAELKRLWGEWKVKMEHHQEAYTAHRRAEDAYAAEKAEIGAPWLYAGVEPSNYPGASLAIVERRVPSWMRPSNRCEQRLTPIIAKRVDGVAQAIDECKERNEKALAKYKRDCAALRKRHRVDALERGYRRATRSLEKTEAQIYKAAAEGLAGVAIKFCIWERWQRGRLYATPSEPPHNGKWLDPLCKEAQQLAGLDLEAGKAVLS